MNEQQYAERVKNERGLGLAMVRLQGIMAHADLGLDHRTGLPTEPWPTDYAGRPIIVRRLRRNDPHDSKALAIRHAGTPIYDALAGAR